jgi:hypothetical protein
MHFVPTQQKASSTLFDSMLFFFVDPSIDPSIDHQSVSPLAPPIRLTGHIFIQPNDDKRQ